MDDFFYRYIWSNEFVLIYLKNTDNVFVYIFNKICANFAQVGRMKIKINLI